MLEKITQRWDGFYARHKRPVIVAALAAYASLAAWAVNDYSRISRQRPHYPIISNADDAAATQDYRKLALIVDALGTTEDFHRPFVYDRSLSWKTDAGIDFTLTLYNFNEDSKEFPQSIREEYGGAFDEQGRPHDVLEIQYVLPIGGGIVIAGAFADDGLRGVDQDPRCEDIYQKIRSHVLRNVKVSYPAELIENKGFFPRLEIIPMPQEKPEGPKFEA